MEKPTIIIRHRKENLAKCSLRGLEEKEEFLFLQYPACLKNEISFEGYSLLDMEGDLLDPSIKSPFILLDGSWRYAEKMMRTIKGLEACKRVKLPASWATAYPRHQTLCPDPGRGLASIEALFAAFLMTKRNSDYLLDHYYWKDQFIEKNKSIIDFYKEII
jgi:pre-rRNA-processing protein TSR3